MLGNFPACWAFTRQAEGGLVDDPADPGGLTNFGISQRAYPNLDIRHLTEQAAAAIYQRDYWNRVAGDSLAQGVDLMVFDMAVNAGVSASVRLVQAMLGLTEDGVLGSMTLAALAPHESAWLINGLHMARVAYYQRLASFLTFGTGWVARADNCMASALAMVISPAHSASLVA